MNRNCRTGVKYTLTNRLCKQVLVIYIGYFEVACDLTSTFSSRDMWDGQADSRSLKFYRTFFNKKLRDPEDIYCILIEISIICSYYIMPVQKIQNCIQYEKKYWWVLDSVLFSLSNTLSRKKVLDPIITNTFFHTVKHMS